MKNAFLKIIVGAWLLCAAALAAAFTPAGGLWGFTNELNGQPGRGFQLTVENDVLVYYYYGYDSDGSREGRGGSGPKKALSVQEQMVSGVVLCIVYFLHVCLVLGIFATSSTTTQMQIVHLTTSV